MEPPPDNPKAAVLSSTRTDYGTTTSSTAAAAPEPPTDPQTAQTTQHDDEALRQRFSSHSSQSKQFSYQSLPAEPGHRILPRNSQGSFVVLASRRHHKMSVDTMPNSEARQIMQRVEYFLNVINQICIGFVTIYMSWTCLRTSLAGTGLHAWLVTIGYCFLMAEGIMCHYSNNVLTFSYKRTTKTTVHWVLQALGGGLGLAGTLIKLIQKGFHLQSTHSKLGFASFILCLVSLLSGLSALFSMRVKKILNPLLNKTFHNLLGVGTFVCAMLAQYYGYSTGFFSRKADADFRYMIGVITLLSMVLTCIGPLKALYHKTRNIIRHFN